MATVFTLLVMSSLTAALPFASAASTVVVTIPPGAGGASAQASNAPGYSPDTITVVIGVNNTVEWINNDTLAGKGTAHTVTDTTQPSGGGFVGSGNLDANQSWSFTFTVPGTYQYHCGYHSWMSGTVVVLAQTAQAPEFPTAALAAVLFAVIAAVVVAAPRLRGAPPVAPGGA